MNSIPEIEITAVSELVEIVEKIGSSRDFVYRGQKNFKNKTPRPHHDKELTTTLERCVDTDETRNYVLEGAIPLELRYLDCIEHQIISEFRKGCQQYTTRPDEKDYLQWLALMQHHGAPTRLLDVTRSLFVALFFAVTHNDDVDGVIYAFFDPSWFYADTPAQQEPPEVKANQVLAPQFKIWPGQIPSIDEQYPGILKVKPLILNRRQIAQQGEFLMPFRIDHSFEDNLFATFNLRSSEILVSIGDNRAPTNKNPIIKYIIPRSLFPKIRLTLNHMNLSAASLFPDLEGFARSMYEIAQQWRF